MRMSYEAELKEAKKASEAKLKDLGKMLWKYFYFPICEM
jgi:hypothetical protein